MKKALNYIEVMHLILDSWWECLWDINMEMSNRQVNRPLWSSENKYAPQIYIFILSIYRINRLPKSVGVYEIDNGEDIEGNKNKAKDGTWKTTTLKRQKVYPEKDWEATFIKVGWEHKVEEIKRRQNLKKREIDNIVKFLKDLRHS